MVWFCPKKICGVRWEVSDGYGLARDRKAGHMKRMSQRDTLVQNICPINFDERSRYLETFQIPPNEKY